MPKFTKHLSPARARLRDAITAKAAGVADVALVQSRIDRLRSVVDWSNPVRLPWPPSIRSTLPPSPLGRA